MSGIIVSAIAAVRRGANSDIMDKVEITAKTMFDALQGGTWKLQPPSVRAEWLAKARALHAAIDAGKWPGNPGAGI
ncbi:MAG: hypothetical protein CMH69_19625 [Nitratireductor sp.]|jgi:hypothetical protein|nr:hypothetical protein [Nitratireductor sp.]